MSAQTRDPNAGPWAMKPDRVVELVSGVADGADPAALADRFAPCAATRLGGGALAREAAETGYAVRGSVAVIPIGGVLTKNPSVWEDWLGVSFGSTYAEIARGMANALDAWRDGRVGSALLLADSPGGTVSGVQLAVDAVRNAREAGMHVAAFADDLDASASYWITAQASELSAHRLSAVGSIGVYATLVDWSKAAEEEGARVHLVKAGRHKGIGTAGVPITEGDLAVIQEEIDALYGQFVADVAAGRGIDEARARELGDGRVHLGADAVAVGLADRLETLDAVLERLDAEHGPGKRNGGKAAQRGGRAMKADTNGTGGAPKAVEDLTGAGAGGVDIAEITRAAAEAGAKAATEAIAAEKAKADAADKARREEIAAVLEPFANVAGIEELRREATAPGAAMTAGEVVAKAAKIAASGTRPLGLIEVGASGRDRMLDCAASMLAERARPGLAQRMKRGGEKAERVAELLGLEKAADFADQVREAESGGLRRHGLKGLAEMLIHPSAARGFRTDDDVYRAAFAHGTSDFPILLESTANRILLSSFGEQRTTYEAFAATGNLRDFRQTELVRMSELPDLKLIPDGKDAEEGSFNERSESIRLETYGRKFSLSRRMFINDDLGAFSRLPAMWGMIAARVPEDLAYQVLTSNPAMDTDNKALFHADHKNLATAAALSVTSLAAAKALMRKQTGFGPDAAFLDLLPNVLIVPVALETKANQINQSEWDPAGLALAADSSGGVGGTAAVQAGGVMVNTERGMWNVIANPRLDKVSSTAWFIAVEPGAHRAIEVGFLDGRREPTVSRLTNGSALGESFEIIFDCAAAPVDHEAIVKNAGA